MADEVESNDVGDPTPEQSSSSGSSQDSDNNSVVILDAPEDTFQATLGKLKICILSLHTYLCTIRAGVMTLQIIFLNVMQIGFIMIVWTYGDHMNAKSVAIASSRNGI